MAATIAPPPPTLIKARARSRTTTMNRAQPDRTRAQPTRTRRAAPRAQTRRAAPRRVSHPITPFTPLAAVGRTAIAVTTIPDSGLVVRMTRGRAWIGVLGVLLTGIVGLNVLNLSLSSSSGRANEQGTQLERANSALRAQIAEQLSNERVQGAALKLGMLVPEPGDIAYLNAGSRDAANAARRLGAGTLTAAASPMTLASAPVPVQAAPTAPNTITATTGGAPAPAAQPAPAPVTPPAQQPAPTQPVSNPAPSSGGGGGIAPN